MGRGGRGQAEDDDEREETDQHAYFVGTSRAAVESGHDIA